MSLFQPHISLLKKETKKPPYAQTEAIYSQNIIQIALLYTSYSNVFTFAFQYTKSECFQCLPFCVQLKAVGWQAEIPALLGNWEVWKGKQWNRTDNYHWNKPHIYNILQGFILQGDI